MVLPKKGTPEYDNWILTPEYKEHCRKSSERILSRPPWNKGRKLPHLSGENSPMFGRIGNKHPRFGHPQTEDWCKNASERMKGDNNPSRKNPPWNAGIRCPQISGEKHHNWKGGVSHTPYPWTFLSRRKFYRMLYGNICFECEKTPEENGRNLTVHHYDYDKNSVNCIPLCHSCNSKANYDRDYWEKYYTEMVKGYWEWILS